MEHTRKRREKRMENRECCLQKRNFSFSVTWEKGFIFQRKKRNGDEETGMEGQEHDYDLIVI